MDIERPQITDTDREIFVPAGIYALARNGPSGSRKPVNLEALFCP